MAKQRVHGITIDLDVNTSGVAQGFSEINKSLSQTSRELKTVDRMLKDDANNVTLLAQKQNLLTDAIDKTQDKLVQLAKAKKIADSDSSIDRSSKEYRELERDIIKTSNSLRSLTEQQKQTNAQMERAKTSIDGVGDALSDASGKTLTFGDMLKANVISEAIISGVKALASAFKDVALELNNWANDYREMEVYEKQFESNIRNTAGASDEQIKKLKQLANAKERQGVISKRSITSAYQELATYVESTDAIEGLTDALLDMSAQQYGVDATEESVRNIATTLGKALANGDFSGLTRLGYGFDDAQKYIMKYGDELERVAVINEVVESSIGGMNEALAQTDAGMLFQYENVFGDFKENIGGIVSELELLFAEGVMPEIQVLLDNIILFLDEHKEDFVQMVTDIVTWLTSDEAKEFFLNMADLVINIADIFANLVQITDQLGLFDDALTIVKETLQMILDITNQIVEDINIFREYGLFGRGNYIDNYWADRGLELSPSIFGSGGYGLNSGGFNSGGIIVNAQFTINESAMNRGTFATWGYQIAEAINTALGEQI